MTIQSKILSTLRSQARSIDWDAIYAADLPRIYNYFVYKIGDREAAEDLTAVTFERAWKHRRRYRRALASPTTWLFGIARNVLREHFRHRKKNKQRLEPLSSTHEMSLGIDIEQNLQQQQNKETLRKILLELPERERELIALKYGAGLNNRKIAKITGLSESNVGTVLHRTVKQLREKWGDHNG